MMQKFFRSNQGFTITELMIALVLSTFLVGGILSVYVGNVRTNQVNTMMSQAQQASQISFQLFARDFQHAGFTGCGNMISERVVNVLRVNANDWWAHWNEFPVGAAYAGLQGYEAGDSKIKTISGSAITPVSDAVRMMYGRGDSASVVSHNLASNPPLRINQNIPQFRKDDIVLACDSKMAVIFQLTNVIDKALYHDKDVGTPGNGSLDFGFGVNGVRIPQALTPDAGMVVPLESVAWFVGTEGGVNSLYRSALVGNKPEIEMVLSGVSTLDIQYLRHNQANYVDANVINNANAWPEVVAARVTIVMQNDPKMPTPDDMRTISQVINLRNH